MNDNPSGVALTVSGTTGIGTVAEATGLIGTINEYAVVIGLSISLLSLFVGLYFHRETVKWREKKSAEDIEKLRADILEELRRDQGDE